MLALFSITKFTPDGTPLEEEYEGKFIFLRALPVLRGSLY